MTTLRLAPIRWMLVTHEDYDAFRRSGATSLNGGFAEAASAQGVYFEPGTISQARQIRMKLRALGERFPSADQVQQALAEVDTSLYDMQVESDRWYLRNKTQPTFDNPFEGRRWILLLEAPQGWRAVGIRGSLERALDLLPWLDGTHSAPEITDAILNNPAAIQLLQDLLALEVVTGGPAIEVDLEALPEFQFLGHSGFFVRDGSDLLLVDPMLVPSTRALASSPLLEPMLARASGILISHNHWDHLHYPTLTRLPRDIRIVVPRVRRPSFSNPPMAAYLRALGFTRVEERDPGDEIQLGGITLRCVAFHGEPFGLNSRFDALTYHIRFGTKTLYGSVDAAFDEEGDMEAVIDEVASWGAPDLFLFGSSGQQHDPPFLAAGLRYFSNELVERPDLCRYHPTVVDAERWARKLQPRALVPYAQFLFTGDRAAHVRGDAFLNGNDVSLGQIPRRHGEWAQSLAEMAHKLDKPMHLFQPMQGIRFESATS